jgi:hypothetical protein
MPVKFWETKLIPATLKAVETGELLSLLKTNKEKAFADHSHALGIGNVKFFLIKGKVSSNMWRKTRFW